MKSIPHIVALTYFYPVPLKVTTYQISKEVCKSNKDDLSLENEKWNTMY